MWYLGKWHEIYKIPNFFEEDQSCITANYSLEAGGHIKVFNQGVTNGQPVSKTGDAYVPDPSDPAKLMVKFSEDSPYAPYWVLDTNYMNYTVVFSCESFGKIAHVQFAWILSRNITITESLDQKLFQILENNGVPTSYLKKTDQSNCTSLKK
ncbi:apolipoprotein D [Patella vulgata]|uniref:apolipoprotein D n=1 Tax=Patella vulgata TaxID=6465 RepID=UPI00218048A7|nr:apolipoprotein D [Patella vulgata]